MNISLENFLIFIPLIILAFVLGLALNKYLSKQKEDLTLDNANLQKNHEDLLKNLQDVNEKVNSQLTTLRDKISADLNNVSSNLGTNRGIVESKSNQILIAQEKLLDSLTGSKRFGTTGELLLQNLLEHSGLVKGKQWVQNHTVQKDGKTFSFEFGIVHPTKLVFPVDAHWPKTKYEELLDVRKLPYSDEREETDKIKLKEIIKDYSNKAESVSKKYINSGVTLNFACIYIPSDSLHHEVNSYVTDNKELFISEIHRKYKVSFMGPSTFSAYCDALMLGFSSLEVDQRAKNFQKYVDQFKSLIVKNLDEVVKHNNKVIAATNSASEILKTSEKLKTEMDKVEQALKEIDQKEVA
jgi:DNA recombination protein RmuC